MKETMGKTLAFEYWGDPKNPPVIVWRVYTVKNWGDRKVPSCDWIDTQEKLQAYCQYIEEIYPGSEVTVTRYDRSELL